MILLKDEEAIVAQATPVGSGAIAMIRVSGKNAIGVTSLVAHLPGKQSLLQKDSHTIHYGWVVDGEKQHVDQVLFLLMKGPRTFTGQDVVEITCHNNQIVVEQIIDELIKAGARVAEAGEFTKRAVLNEKIDLVQAEAINDLIHAQTSAAVKASLQQLDGSFSSWIAVFERRIIELVGLCEASFEFIDEEMTFDQQIREKLNVMQEEIADILKTFDKQQYVREGVRIALVGAANAGKSSLFNALLNKQRAIVTNIAGTTRDSIEAGMLLEGSNVTFIDTAGIRETDDVIEQHGIDRSFQEVVQADIVVLVFDASYNYSAEEAQQYQNIVQKYQDKTIVVQNKIDHGSQCFDFIDKKNMVSVSAQKGTNVALLQSRIVDQIQALLDQGQSPCLLNKRQYNLLLQLQQFLMKLQVLIQDHIEYEIVAMELKQALEKLSELTGKTVAENAMDAVFKDFCVGK